MTWLDDLLLPLQPGSPTRPTVKKPVGRLQTLDNQGISDKSDTSDRIQTDVNSQSEENCHVEHAYIFPEPGKPHPWPTIGHLGQCYDCVPLVLPQNPNAIILCFAEGVPLAGKRRAVQYAVQNWKKLLQDMALPFDGSIRYCWIEGFEGF